MLGSGENFRLVENFRMGRKFWVHVKILGLGENFSLGQKFQVGAKILGLGENFGLGLKFWVQVKILSSKFNCEYCTK